MDREDLSVNIMKLKLIYRIQTVRSPFSNENAKQLVETSGYTFFVHEFSYRVSQIKVRSGSPEIEHSFGYLNHTQVFSTIFHSFRVVNLFWLFHTYFLG